MALWNIEDQGGAKLDIIDAETAEQALALAKEQHPGRGELRTNGCAFHGKIRNRQTDEVFEALITGVNIGGIHTTSGYYDGMKYAVVYDD